MCAAPDECTKVSGVFVLRGVRIRPEFRELPPSLLALRTPLRYIVPSAGSAARGSGASTTAGRFRSARVPGAIQGPVEVSSMICRISWPSITSRSINRLASASSDARRAFQQRAHFLDRFVDDPPHFLIDFAGRLLAVASCRETCRGPAGEKRRCASFRDSSRGPSGSCRSPSPCCGRFRWPVPDRFARRSKCRRRSFLRRSCRPAALGCGLSSSRLRHQIAIVLGPLHRVAQRRQAARNDRHFMHRIGVRQAVGDQGMAAFVIGDAQFFVVVDDPLAAFPGRR